MDFVFQRSYRGPLKAVVLDWAGTTLDYGCFAPAVVFMEVFKRKGVEISIDEARVPMGSHKKTHIELISKDDNVARRWEAVHGHKPDAADVEAMYIDFIPRQMACLADYADLIPGTLEAVAEFRRRGLKVRSPTGYTEEMTNLLRVEAKQRGYEPDSTVCATQVPAGRPHPYMCFQNAIQLQVYPMEAIVKIGDTLPDIDEGLNAGMWTIGLAKTGNELGLTEKQVAEEDPAAVATKLARAYQRMSHAGAHYVVDGIADVMPALDDIHARLARGERP
jgi:phosphonoacetaldehyde hydrolase